MTVQKLLPMVAYGTITSNSGAECLSFLSLDPITGIIPMKSEVFTVLFKKDGRMALDDFDASRAKNEGEEIHKIFSKLGDTEGLELLWVSPTCLIALGNPALFPSLSLKICAVLKEVLGEIEFQRVPHNEARPLFLGLKNVA